MFLQPGCLGLLCCCLARITYAFFWLYIVFKITVWLVSSVHTCALRIVFLCIAFHFSAALSIKTKEWYAKGISGDDLDAKVQGPSS